MPASGTYDYNRPEANAFDPASLGAIVSKSVSLNPRLGNPPPRLHETSSGLLNAVGIPSDSVEVFCRKQLPILQNYQTVRIVSIAAGSPSDFARAAAVLDNQKGINALELNFSCPNLGDGIKFGSNPELAAQTVASIKKTTSLPIIVKLSPNVTSITEIAQAVESAGADVLCVANTITAMAIDIQTHRPILGNITGGLSGPAIKPVILRMVWETAAAVNIPIIGVGGIATATDALEYLLAGATAIQVGTANFANPLAMPQIIEGIENYLEEGGFASVQEIVGLARKNV